MTANNRSVAASAFIDHVKRMSASENALFKQEFQVSKRIAKQRATIAAHNPMNVPKNRYQAIVPYDETRVKLQAGHGTDYINANYIAGYNSTRDYIACQGPLSSTRRDFWRMVWEQHVSAIVMLTRCWDKNVEKCDHYWPEDARVCYNGDISVEVVMETVEQEWTLAQLKLSKNGQIREVTHFQYTTWPDFGTPSRPKTLIDFVNLIQDNVQSLEPLVVHCSAGVGRTGTYIALDMAMQQLRSGQPVDVFGNVVQIRQCRMEMVETLEQYIFVHKCIEELIKAQK